MRRTNRTPKTKGRLLEITRELSAPPLWTNSLNVVREFRKRHTDLILEEREAIIDLGLMVLAGRVAISKSPESNLDLFGETGFRELVRLKFKVGNKSEIRVYDARSMTPSLYFEGLVETVDREPKAPKVTGAEAFHTVMKEMRAKGFDHMTVPEYLGRR